MLKAILIKTIGEWTDSEGGIETQVGEQVSVRQESDGSFTAETSGGECFDIFPDEFRIVE